MIIVFIYIYIEREREEVTWNMFVDVVILISTKSFGKSKKIL